MKSFKIVILFIALSFGYPVLGQTVYTTKTGEKYHKSSCHHLKYSKKEIKIDKAKALGYKACKVCKPTINNTKKKSSSAALTSKKEQKSTTTRKAVSNQCTGKTKSGSRCKRKTKNSSGRCYQH